MRALAVVLLLVSVPLSGCSALQDLFDDRPDITVERTPLVEGGWNTDPRFLVRPLVAEPVEVRIEATGSGQTLSEAGLADAQTPVQLLLTDGTWTVTYWVAGHEWETFKDVRVDTVPPDLDALERIGDAQDGAYELGAGVSVPADVTLRVYAGQALIADRLPVHLTGLASGLHTYQVVATDPAGNEAVVLVQVRAGDAKALPQGQWDFGIVARYTNHARLWDLSDLDAYLSPAAAASEAGDWLGSGQGITPDDPVVQGVVDAVLVDEDTTAEIAWSLYHWMYDALEYDEARLASTTLMLPAQVIQDTEDPDGEAEAGQDAGDDGLADDGPGNGVAGGVCRDLAATYVSLLRAAGVPARLVSGYLAGNVDGFHAWVEVYVGQVGDNPGPWLPVDVSPIDGRWDDDPQNDGVPAGFVTAITAFGIRLPEYLALDQVPAPEAPGWSTALSTAFTYPQASGRPDIRFEKDVTVVGQSETAELCFDPDTLERAFRTDCAGYHFPGFVVFTERVIDYGVQVVRAGPGTQVHVELSHPAAEAVAPDAIEYIVYGQAYSEADGRVVADFSA